MSNKSRLKTKLMWLLLGLYCCGYYSQRADDNETQSSQILTKRLTTRQMMKWWVKQRETSMMQSFKQRTRAPRAACTEQFTLESYYAPLNQSSVTGRFAQPSMTLRRPPVTLGYCCCMQCITLSANHRCIYRLIHLRPPSPFSTRIHVYSLTRGGFDCPAPLWNLEPGYSLTCSFDKNRRLHWNVAISQV